MNLTLDRAPALSAISRVVGVVDRNHSIEICCNVLVKAEGDQLTVRGTDLDMEATEVLSARIAAEGGITIPADKLHDIVRNSEPGCQIALAAEGADPRARVKAGRSQFKVPVLPADAFPDFPEEGLGEEITISAKTLSGMLSRVLWATSKAKSTAAISCVYLATVGDQLHAVGGTGAGVALAREARPEGGEIQVLLLPKSVQRILSWLGDEDREVKVSCSERMIRLRHEAGKLVSKVYDPPKYLPYEKVLLEAHDVHAETDQDALKAALKRALIMADDKSHSVELSFSSESPDGSSMTIRAKGGMAGGEGVDEIPVDYDGPDRSILLKAADLESALNALRGDRVLIGFAREDGKDSRSISTVIRAPADPSYLVTLAQPRA